jgi:hypothetical protein
MGSVAKVSAAAKMNLAARVRRAVGLENGGPVLVSVVDGEIRIRAVRSVLADLEAEAQVAFSGFGETVDGFPWERRKGAKDERDVPA